MPGGGATRSLRMMKVAGELRDLSKYFLTSTKVMSPGSTLWISLMPVAISVWSPISSALMLVAISEMEIGNGNFMVRRYDFLAIVFSIIPSISLISIAWTFNRE